MPKLTKSIEAARTDTRDMVILTQMSRNVNAEQTIMTADNGSVRSLMEYKIPAPPQCGAAVT